MDVTILIRSKNEEGTIGETLSRIQKQRFDGKFEILVVDSGSTDATVQIAKDFGSRIYHISQRLFSYGKALNLGTEKAKGDYVVNLSAHAKPKSDNWLQELIGGFETERVAGAYGKQISVGAINPFEALKNEQFFGSERQMFYVDRFETLQDMHFSNSNAAIKKTVWERFKFNEVVGWAEDILWQNQVLKAGHYIVYVPEAAVEHTHAIDLFGAYRSSKDCAMALALMGKEKRNLAMAFLDSGIFMGFLPKAVLENLWYVWRKRYLRHLKITPIYILSAWLGWLVGRLDYRRKGTH
jgi:glycosyltransferase involved in cell wall biosynthesis